MTIKVQCGCGARYSFEVEPQNGAMPFAVNCPACNADGTAAANQVIAQTPAAEPPAAPRLRMQAAAPTVQTAPAPLPVAPLPTAAAAANLQKLKAEARQTKIFGWVLALVFLLIVAAAGGWFWYSFFGTKPRLALSIKLPGADSGWRAQFLEGGKILAASPDRVLVHDLRTDKDLWSTALPGKGGIGDMPPPRVFADKQNIWVCPGDQVVRLDAKTGEVKQTVPIVGQLTSFVTTESNILVVSATDETSRIVAGIDLATGDVSTRHVEVPRAQKHAMPDELPPNVQPTADVLLAQATEENKFNKPLDAVSSEFISTGQNLVELRVKLLEAKVTWVKSIKPRGRELIDNNLSASTSVAGVEEQVFNDIKRDKTGGVKPIDESHYEVRLRRWLGDKPSEWKGDVNGLPSFFSLPSVDLLTAGKNLAVFDKQNNKLFDAALSYPVNGQFVTNNPRHLAPAAERAGVLYVFDQAVLTALSLPGGQVLWRLTSVGISRVQFDGDGMMYVDTTGAIPEDIQYSDQIHFETIPPVIMKVDPRSGKILWQVQKLGQHCRLSGKYVYTVSQNQGGGVMAVGLADAINAPRPEGPAYFHIHRLDAATGKELWDFFREDAGDDVDFQQNTFIVRFGNDLQEWKFLDF